MRTLQTNRLYGIAYLEFLEGQSWFTQCAETVSVITLKADMLLEVGWQQLATAASIPEETPH